MAAIALAERTGRIGRVVNFEATKGEIANA